MADIKVCTFAPEMLAKLKKFRFRKEKTNAAVILKVEMKTMEVEIDEEMDACTIEEVAEELPEFSPRYIVYSYCHSHGDGRVSYPLMFIYYCPTGTKPEHNMIYAGTKPALLHAIDMTKVFDVRQTDEMTEEWVKGKLAFFK